MYRPTIIFLLPHQIQTFNKKTTNRNNQSNQTIRKNNPRNHSINNSLKTNTTTHHAIHQDFLY